MARRSAVLSLLALLLFAGAARADELGDLKARFEREKKADYQTRQKTIQEIANLKTEAAARFLIKVVDTDADRSMRLNTIYRVAQIPLPIAYRAVLRFYEDQDLKSSAFSALVSYIQEDLPKKIVDEVLASSDQGLRSNLIRYFGRRKDKRLIPESLRFLDDLPTGTTSLVNPLTQYPSLEGARILIRIYDDNRQYDRDQIPKFFAEAEDEIKAALPEAIEKAPPDIMLKAAIIAARAAVAQAEPALVGALSAAKDSEIRAVLIESLGAVGAKSDAARELLLDAVERPNEIECTAAVKAIRKSPIPEAIPVLIGLMRREKEGVLRIEVQVTLEVITGQQFGGRLDLWEAWWARYGAEFDPTAVKPPDPDALNQTLVDLAIEKGAAALRAMRGEDKPWEFASHPVGTTALVVLALHAAGDDRKDRDIRAGIKYLLDEPAPATVYDLGIEAMALEVVDGKRYKRRIAECAKKLIDFMNANGYWGYPSGDGDHSNTQYAVLGLRSAARVGIKIPKTVWARIIEHFYNSRTEDGGWSYHPSSGSTVSSSSMTSAGVTCLLICLENAELTEEERATLKRTIDGGFDTLGEKMKLDKDSLYALYGIERAGVLGSRTLMGGNPWYVPGARRLIEEQSRDGHWRPGYNEPVQTSFAILSLKKATAPISSR